MFEVAAAVALVGEAVDALARGLDPDLITASDAMALVAQLEPIERQLAGAKMVLAGRVAESQVWKHRGDRSAAHWLAGQSGTAVGDAVNVLETARRLKELPLTAGAVRDGKLSKAQAVAVADAAVVAPGAEAALLSVAQRESLGGLRAEAARRKHAHLDEQQRHDAIHASRHARFGTDPDGAATLGVRTTPAAMAEIKTALTHHQNASFETARKEGRREPFEAYAADGLLAMARASMGQGQGRPKRVATKAVIRVDHDALQRGHVQPGEVCEIPGVGPLAVAQVQQILAEGEAFAAAVATDHTGRVVSVAHLGHRPVTDPGQFLQALREDGHEVITARSSRAPDAYQRTALDWTSPRCSVEGCDQPRHEIDHRQDWAQTHHTQLDELDGLCRHHHALKTRQNYHLAPGTGRRPLLAPTGTDPP